jgi:hypothetical protein
MQDTTWKTMEIKSTQALPAIEKKNHNIIEDASHQFFMSSLQVPYQTIQLFDTFPQLFPYWF